MPPSPERARKRPRPEPQSPSSPPPPPPPCRPNSSPSSSSESSAGDAAFAAALAAEVAAGASVSCAVTALFDADAPAARGRLCGRAVAAPVLAALQAKPTLAADLNTVARMCRAVYELAEEDLDALRVPRKRLQLGIGEVTDVGRLIEGATKIVVLTGAGVSVSCGIPDFRSKGGLYDTVLERFGLADPQAIFDLEEFKMDPRLFYSFAKDVMPSTHLRPSATHAFVAELEARGKLLRNYSQNIDGLERRAGVSEDRVILCHGSFLSATCMRKSCRVSIPGTEIAVEVAAGIVPLCRQCRQGSGAKAGGHAGEQDSGSEEDGEQDAESMGVLKPDIVFFGENLPKRVGENLERDVAEADLLLVLGTSLQVAPVARIPQYFRDNVPRILVNRELVGYDFDVELLGDCDVVTGELCKALGWPDLKKTILDPDANGGVAKRSMKQDSNEDTARPKKESNTEIGVVATGSPSDLRQASEECVSALGAAEGDKCIQTSRVTFVPPRRFLFAGASESTHGTLESSDELVGRAASKVAAEAEDIPENASESPVKIITTADVI